MPDTGGLLGNNTALIVSVVVFVVIAIIICIAVCCCLKTISGKLCFVLGGVFVYFAIDVIQYIVNSSTTRTLFFEQAGRLRDSLGGS